jgi:uncharacterized lipoprotein YddW (UPF0748 family)/CubicO group peptidase (beta-lactamase class C family)
MKINHSGYITTLLAMILFLIQCATQKPNVIVPVKEQRESRELPAIPREFRAAWIASVANINWPSKPGLTSAQQKAEAIALLDLLQELNFNAAILQIRPQCDALYQSDLEPWSYYLTGVQGQAPQPYYDPLQFWVAQAHKRGIELHAWLNPYRAHHISGGPVSEYSVVSRHPELVVKLKTGYYWLDPANPETQEHSYNVVMDIVKRYDIDGIHFDDYFYPYPSYNNDEDFPDEASWQLYQDNGGKLSRGDWRRDAVNRFIERLYTGIHQEKSHVKFGLSPFGIWRPGHPPSIEGFDQYDKLYADAKLWLNKGWIDYFTPQLYWTVNKIPQSFPVLLGWWQKENKKQRHLWPGMSIGRLKGEKAVDETINQIMITRGMLPQSPGAVHWSIAPLQTNNLLAEALLAGPYRQQALIPSSPWLNNTAQPAAAPVVNVQKNSDSLKIQGQQFSGEQANQTIIYSRYGDYWKYHIYGNQTRQFSLPLQQINNRISLKEFAQKEGLEKMLLPLNKIAVSFVGRGGNESEAFKMEISADANSYIPFNLKSLLIDRLFTEYNRDSLPGAAVMVIKNGEIVFQKGYGFANLETKDSVTAQSNFRLASVTKAFTAMAILQLVEKGKLKLDSKLTDVLADFPAYGHNILISNLLSHTSGLQDYENLVPSEQTEQLKDNDVLGLLKTVDTLYFAPGSKYQYSNSAYAILSLIVEKLSGIPFRTYLQQNIFKVSAMDNTLAYEKGINEVPLRAFGYTVSNKKVELSDQSQTSAVLGDGGVYSSLDDMYKWDQVLYTNKLLGKGLLDNAFTKQQLNNGSLIDYGFGWHLENYRDMEIKYHSGSTRGFRNIFYRIPEKQFSIVVLTNRNGFGSLSTMQLAHRLTDLFLFE